MAPYRGQGDPLSASAGYTGDWIVGGEIFLCKGIGSNSVRLQQIASGKIAIGFSAEDLSALFRISPDELMAANRRKELSIVEAPPSPRASGTVVRTFGFSMGKSIHLVEMEETLP
jgi:hypothetical protein